MSFATAWFIAALAAAPTPSPSWDRACKGLADFWPDTCDKRFDNAYERGLCRVAQEQARRVSHVVVQNVRRNVTYNARMQRFEVQVPGVLSAEIRDPSCDDEDCISRLLVARALTWPTDPTRLGGLLRGIARRRSTLGKPVMRFYVPLMDVGEPRTFEKRLRVDAIFKIVRSTTSPRTQTALTAHALVGPPVGIRATLQDGIWAREIRKPPAHARCLRPPALGRGPVASRRVAKKATPKTKKPAGSTTSQPAGTSKRRLSRQQITATIDHHGAAIRVCYNKELGQKPDLAGRITFQFTIATSGRTSQVRQTERTLPSEAVAECIKAVLEDMTFPRFEGSPLTIVYPFTFGVE